MAATQEARHDYSASSIEGRPPQRSVEEMRELMPRLSALPKEIVREARDIHEIYDDFLGHLETGALRAAERQEDGTWVTDETVREFIPVGFRIGDIIEMTPPGTLIPIYDRHTLPPQHILDFLGRNIRTVATGTARRGSFLGNNDVIMNGGYVNVGAYVGAGTMVDSNALVGSGAQVGKKNHVSAGVIIAGVLEPKGEHPVSLGDNVFVGAGSILAEGTVVGDGSAIAAGTTIHRRTLLFDEVNDRFIMPVDGRIYVPDNALVIPAVIPSDRPNARTRGIGIPGAMIARYYDPSVPMDQRRDINEDLR